MHACLHNLGQARALGVCVAAAASLLACVAEASRSTLAAPTPAPNNVTVFSLGEAGYFCIKIPYLIRTQAGTLIAFAEARGKVGWRVLSAPRRTVSQLVRTPFPPRQ